jgi:hypothetical protein
VLLHFELQLLGLALSRHPNPPEADLGSML